MQRSEIRSLMRTKRNRLSKYQQQTSATTLASHCQNQLNFIRKSRVALYLANDGEIDTHPLIRKLQQRNIQCYLPVLHPTKKNSLWFCPYNAQTKMRKNRFGIMEPDFRKHPHVPPWTLSAALFPLVAFDQAGGRVGMGGGFYDRTFATAKPNGIKLHQRTRLIGLAHHFQELDKLPIEPWDVPLSAIAHDKGVITVKTKEKLE